MIRKTLIPFLFVLLSLVVQGWTPQLRSEYHELMTKPVPKGAGQYWFIQDLQRIMREAGEIDEAGNPLPQPPKVEK